MDDALMQAYARLNVHEFVLEVMMANWVAGMTAADGERFLSDFSDRFRNAWVAGTPTTDDATTFRILQDAGDLTEHFARKVRERAASIRAQHSGRPTG